VIDSDFTCDRQKSTVNFSPLTTVTKIVMEMWTPPSKLSFSENCILASKGVGEGDTFPPKEQRTTELCGPRGDSTRSNNRHRSRWTGSGQWGVKNKSDLKQRQN